MQRRLTHQFHEVFGLANLIGDGQKFVVADHQDSEWQVEKELGQHRQLIATGKENPLVKKYNLNHF